MDVSAIGPTAVPAYGAGAFKDFAEFVNNVLKAIQDEASAIEFYTALERVAPQSDQDFITHARNDEKTHLKLFRRMYRSLTGQKASVQVTPTQFSSYKAGLDMAFRRELEAAELYRDMYLSTTVPSLRDILFKTMTDEMEHAQRFSYLYFKQP